MSGHVLILGGNYIEALRFVRERTGKLLGTQGWYLLTTPDELKGLLCPVVVGVGGYQCRRDFPEWADAIDERHGILVEEARFE